MPDDASDYRGAAKILSIATMRAARACRRGAVRRNFSTIP
jgi:hypothetical protein